ncbi:hypothetical protein FJTKL_03321 [Diaporthe vaccinii]|uniref:Secreted protein n=1 Tax=Diaporthe vaccinii TaxID=105482 RepID=A0ABR4F239_9PEZI
MILWSIVHHLRPTAAWLLRRRWLLGAVMPSGEPSLGARWRKIRDKIVSSRGDCDRGGSKMPPLHQLASHSFRLVKEERKRKPKT